MSTPGSEPNAELPAAPAVPSPPPPPLSPSLSPPQSSPPASSAPPVPPSPSAPPPAPPSGPAPSPALAEATTPLPNFDPSELTAPFAPLRVEPPPRIFATWWLRYVLLLSQLVGIAVVLLTEYARPDRLTELPTLTPYLLAAAMLVCWSALAMIDAARLVPATTYRRSSSAALAVALWLVAFVAPVVAIGVIEWARDRFADDPDDLAALAATVVALLVCFLLVWLPFRYHTQQAHRIGAPGRVVASWFWLPLGSAVGVLLIQALGLRDMLEENGMTDLERTVEVAVVFGAPALVFALTTWRATTVFDEVIDLRWRRWRTEWQQTLAAMAAQPVPGPEAAASLRDR